MNARRMWTGIGLAALGHLLTLVAMGIALVASAGDEMAALSGAVVEVGAQLVLLVVALVAGLVLIARDDRSLGLGILIGWAVGLLVFPAVGFGICVGMAS